MFRISMAVESYTEQMQEKNPVISIMSL